MTESVFLAKESATPTPPWTGSASGLPIDILRDASRRLGWAGLIYAATFFLAFFGGNLISYSFLGAAQLLQLHPVQIWVAMISIALGLFVFALTRNVKTRPELLLDLGLIFEVVGAFGITMSTWWGAFPVWDPQALPEGFFGIPWECVWIIIFPLLAPNTPGKTTLAALGAASMGPLTLLLSKSAGLTDSAMPLGFIFGYFVFTSYLCAGIAVVISRLVFKYGARLKKAREIGSYKLVERLGEGGMGEVWLAQHRMLVRPAAVKLIRPEALGSDSASARTLLRRFEREAQATAALRSKHTIELYDFGITDAGAFYYVMELLSGLSLHALVKRFGPIPAPRAIHLLRQVCHSLGEAHEAGLIHRDIKPANIYVCRLGPDYDFVKVLDFGLVKRTGGRLDAAGSELTVEGVAAGTPAFMPPEMALGKTEIDARADLYSLGCVAYWLLTGETVFAEEGALATVLAHIQEKPIPPSRRTELEIPADLERLILACLEKVPDDRPHSAAELDGLLAGCAAAGEWDGSKAKDWWTLHLPEVEARPTSTVPERSPAGVLEVSR